MRVTTAFSFALVVAVLSAEPDPKTLRSFQWEKRIVVYQTGDSSLDKLEELIESHSSGIEDRDLIFLRLGDNTDIKFHEPLTQSEQNRIREELDFPESDKTLFLLIGKDGGIKDRQFESLRIKPWFDLIDTMPMRRQEMIREGKRPQ
ncbi:MAG: DUF4174 domain-containing protein [Verrucomicrobiota bacterium]